jgi:hypothetical protein
MAEWLTHWSRKHLILEQTRPLGCTGSNPVPGVYQKYKQIQNSLVLEFITKIFCEVVF